MLRYHKIFRKKWSSLYLITYYMTAVHIKPRKSTDLRTYKEKKDF